MKDANNEVDLFQMWREDRAREKHLGLWEKLNDEAWKNRGWSAS